MKVPSLARPSCAAQLRDGGGAHGQNHHQPFAHGIPRVLRPGQQAGLNGAAPAFVGNGIVQLRGNRRPAAYQAFADRNDVPARDHVFDAEVDVLNRPTGLHAYTNGALPNNVTVLFTHGNVDAVHIIVWTNGVAVNGVRYCKWSTMFPRGMPEGVVCFLLLRAAGIVLANQAPAIGTGYGPIPIGVAGATRYPIHPGSQWIHQKLATTFGNMYAPGAHQQLPALTVNGVTYRITN